MSRSRDKGNRLERDVMPRIIAADGVDALAAAMATGTGRVGNAYHLECDGIPRRFVIECKNQESLADRLWAWLDHIPTFGGTKVRLLVLKKNNRKPVVQLYLDDFLDLIKEKTDASDHA